MVKGIKISRKKYAAINAVNVATRNRGSLTSSDSSMDGTDASKRPNVVSM